MSTIQKHECFLASEWLKNIHDGNFAKFFINTYGPDFDPTDKSHLIQKILSTFKTQFGNGPCILTRAPGRLNIMGRHVDHQGGHGNMIALKRDVYMAVAPRKNNRKVCLKNINPIKFPDDHFFIENLYENKLPKDWTQFVDSAFVQNYSATHQKKWSIYLKSIFARFQAAFPNIKLMGMDIVVGGDVPIAAGLSSSSTLVVAMAEAIVRLNRINVSDQKFVELCGEGEWFVGTRGGAGDHAAMKFAKKNKVVQIGFFPLSKTDETDFPNSYSMVICNSKINAKKTAGAKEQFNQRVACYHFGKSILNLNLAKLGHGVNHLRDFSPENSGLSKKTYLLLLKKLPLSANHEELIHILGPEKYNEIVNRFGKSSPNYPIRDVVIYGLAECDRSKQTPQLFKNGDFQQFGKWMNISHDGDRIAFTKKQKQDYSDLSMDNLFEQYQDNHSTLAKVPGSYACSHPAIDEMVDIVLELPGVLGAQISGAGLGGCMMVFVENDHIDSLKKSLQQKYYTPKNLDPDIITSRPSAGSGVVEI
jgi:N-acetylgalactosamine kinase